MKDIVNSLIFQIFKGKFVIENVISYYEPLIIPYKVGNHYYWSNFIIPNIKEKSRNLIRMKINDKIKDKEKRYKYDLSKYDISNRLKVKILDNMVEPETGLHILNRALEITETNKYGQSKLFV